MSVEMLMDGPRTVVLVGMGLANRAAAGALARRGHRVVAVDDRPTDELRDAVGAIGIVLHEAPDVEALTNIFNSCDLACPAPGLPEAHPAFAVAMATETPVVSEFDLAAVWDDRPILAVTGTNGKTTVVELAVAAFDAAEMVAVAAGNTDVPLVAAIDDPKTEVFVVEASSFRLARSQSFRPQVGVWLNFAPDHLDVHRDLQSYEDAKAVLFEQVAADGSIVANAADEIVMARVPPGRRAITFGASGDWDVVDGMLSGPDGPFIEIGRLWRSLPHDVEDALAVAAAVTVLGVPLDAVARACESFAPLSHRVTAVGEIDNMTYYDDSKATTPHATVAALRGFDRVVLIAGGRNKGIDLSGLATEPDRVAAVVAIGEAAEEVGAAFAGVAPVIEATDMTEAVAAARRLSAGSVPVLLSPGCASFDWYRNYGDRGDDFARIVNELAEATP